MTIYSLDVLLFLFGTSLLFHVRLLPDLYIGFSRGRSGGLVFLCLSEFSIVYCDDFPGGSDGKASERERAGDPGSSPGSGRSPGEERWEPTPVFLPRTPKKSGSKRFQDQLFSSHSKNLGQEFRHLNILISPLR